MRRVQICQLDVRIRWGQTGLGRLNIMRMMTMMMMVMMMFNSMVRWEPTGLGPPDHLIIIVIMRILTIIMMNMMMISKS